MKNFKAELILIILLGMIIQTGCKKYEEGPSLSLRTKTSRVANTWRVEKAEVNNNIATELFKDLVVKMEKSGTFSMTTPQGLMTGFWQFSTNKDQLVITELGGYIHVWHILRLKEKELWVAQEEGSERTEIHFIE